MTDNNNANPEGTQPEAKPQGNADESLQKQIENLNKGIATYRKEVKDAVVRAEAAESRLQELETSMKQAEKQAGDDDLPSLSPEDQKRLEAWAKQQGFATKEEILEERARIQSDNLKSIENQAVDEFLSNHPEYDDDEQWDKLKTEFSQFKQPTTLADYRKLLNKIHKQINPDSGESDRVRADIETRKRLGLGGRSQPSSNDGEKQTIEKLQQKYPRLSRDQIEAKLSEIGSLYKKE